MKRHGGKKSTSKSSRGHVAGPGGSKSIYRLRIEKREREADNLPVHPQSHTGRMLVQAVVKAQGTPKSVQVRDPFQGLYAEGVALQPPLPPEKLLQLAEENAVHGACVNVKSVDSAGRGWTWDPEDEAKAQEAQEQAERTDEKDIPQLINERLESITPDYTFSEMLVQAAWELEAVGWSAWEVLRDEAGAIAALYPMPSQTLRATPDDDVYVQIRGGRRRFFVRFGSDKVIGRDSGQETQEAGQPGRLLPTAQGRTAPVRGGGQQDVTSDAKAAEVLVFKTYSPRSIYYGIPKWINIVPALAELTAIREFNVSWFSSGGQQDRSIHVTAKDGEAAQTLADDIKQQLDSFQGVGHTTLVTSGSEDVKVEVQQLDQPQREGHFRLRRGDLIKEVLMGHNVPPYRIGWAELGSLGGSAAKEMLDAYRFGSIKPMQTILEDRLNQTIFGPKGLDIKGFKFKLTDLDYDEIQAESELINKMIDNAVMSPNEGRERLGMEADADEAMSVRYMKGVPISDVASANAATDVVAELRTALAQALAGETPQVPGAPGGPGGPPSPGQRPPRRPGVPAPDASLEEEPPTGPDAVQQRIRKSAESIVEEFTAKLVAFQEEVRKSLNLALTKKAEVTELHVHIPEAPVTKVEGAKTEIIVPAARTLVRDVERDDDGRIVRIADRPGESHE